MLLPVMALIGCGTDDTYDLRDAPATEQGIAVGVETDANGIPLLLAAAPEEYSLIAYCVIGQTGACTAATEAMTIVRTVAGRKIFKAANNSKVVPNALLLFVATKADGSKIEQKARISSSDTPSSGGSTLTGLNWKVLLMASDQGNTGAWISAFDNARKKLKQIFSARGVKNENFRELSLHQDQQSATVKPTSAANFADSLKSFGAPGPNDACLVHMTSHGSRDGFNLGSNRLSPKQLDDALIAGCGDRPTVVLISACYSGLYVLDSSNLKKPNRIIMTAARHDVTSFGCSPENEYTYWDGCLIEALPTGGKWKDVAETVLNCIHRKEGGSTASFPQSFIGSSVSDLELPKL
jgi:hypothetical protein